MTVVSTNSSSAASLIRLARPADAAAIAAIYNEGINSRGATFETRSRSVDEIRPKLETASRHCTLVALDPDANVGGWAALSAYRERECYAGVAEFSIYLHSAVRGRGFGRHLLMALIAAAGERGFWKLVSRVFPDNAASRALCRSCGFREVGTYQNHGLLDGQLRDVIIVERLILPDAPAASDRRFVTES